MTYEFKVWRKNGLARIYVNGAFLGLENKAWFEKLEDGTISLPRMRCTTQNLKNEEGQMAQDLEETAGMSLNVVDVKISKWTGVDFEAVAAAVEAFNAKPKAVEVDEREARIAEASKIFAQAKKDERKEKKAKNNKIRELILAYKNDDLGFSAALKEARAKGLI